MEHRQPGPGDSVQHTIQEVTGKNTLCSKSKSDIVYPTNLKHLVKKYPPCDEFSFFFS